MADPITNMSIEVSQGPEPDEELDASIQADIDMGGAGNTNAMSFDGAGDVGPVGPDVDPAASAADPRLPIKKDASLREFLGKMDDYAPIVSNIFCSIVNTSRSQSTKVLSKVSNITTNPLHLIT